jgi:hypothetical protein
LPTTRCATGSRATLTARNQLIGLTLGDGSPRETPRLPTVRQPNTVAVDPGTGRVFVTSRADGTLQLVDLPNHPR